MCISRFTVIILIIKVDEEKVSMFNFSIISYNLNHFESNTLAEILSLYQLPSSALQSDLAEFF
jgi:hypothetical protein